jgi:alpha-mannosidase
MYARGACKKVTTGVFFLGVDSDHVLNYISVKNHRDKVYSNASLLVYGNGDGGGGPLASMIERLRRMKNVVK